MLFKREKFVAIGASTMGEELDGVATIKVVVEGDGDLLFDCEYASFTDYSFQGVLARLGVTNHIMKFSQYVKNCEFIFDLISKNRIICRSRKDVIAIKRFFYSNRKLDCTKKKKILLTPDVVSIEEDVMKKKKFVPMIEMVKKSAFTLGQLQEITCEAYDLEYLDDIQPAMFRACMTMAIYLNDKFGLSYNDILEALMEEEVSLPESVQDVIPIPVNLHERPIFTPGNIIPLPSYKMNTY